MKSYRQANVVISKEASSVYGNDWSETVDLAAFTTKSMQDIFARARKLSAEHQTTVFVSVEVNRGYIGHKELAYYVHNGEQVEYLGSDSFEPKYAHRDPPFGE